MLAECTHLDSNRRCQSEQYGMRGVSADRRLLGRLCLTCGHVGCCDESENRHATKHFHASAHPLIQSDEQGEDWIWCYVDELWMEPT